MFGLKNIFSSFINQSWKKLDLSNKLNTVNYMAVNFAHSRGIFSHEKGPRGKQYKPKVMKRIETYGLKTRLQSRGGKQLLWRKILKGQTGWINMVPAP